MCPPPTRPPLLCPSSSLAFPFIRRVPPLSATRPFLLSSVPIVSPLTYPFHIPLLCLPSCSQPVTPSCQSSTDSCYHARSPTTWREEEFRLELIKKMLRIRHSQTRSFVQAPQISLLKSRLFRSSFLTPTTAFHYSVPSLAAS
ncbi:hypothetical protein FIBSPDRAFT_323127 [Athelia psychrophila]|uniref:Uncharacterized protein n=1 Tax=Athelia psychrophila TaxID=1759441 RepID=A0A167WR29_9AGAM|nr:hypothetical protein FIBSPDRAFT_323127 [Fibularhizoctonia sp. CBS 109695]